MLAFSPQAQPQRQRQRQQAEERSLTSGKVRVNITGWAMMGGEGEERGKGALMGEALMGGALM